MQQEGAARRAHVALDDVAPVAFRMGSACGSVPLLDDCPVTDTLTIID